jgi:hypothetical protein
VFRLKPDKVINFELIPNEVGGSVDNVVHIKELSVGIGTIASHGIEELEDVSKALNRRYFFEAFVGIGARSDLAGASGAESKAFGKEIHGKA